MVLGSGSPDAPTQGNTGGSGTTTDAGGGGGGAGGSMGKMEFHLQWNMDLVELVKEIPG